MFLGYQNLIFHKETHREVTYSSRKMFCTHHTILQSSHPHRSSDHLTHTNETLGLVHTTHCSLETKEKESFRAICLNILSESRNSETKTAGK